MKDKILYTYLTGLFIFIANENSRLLALCCELPRSFDNRALAGFDRGNKNYFKKQYVTEDIANL